MSTIRRWVKKSKTTLKRAVNEEQNNSFDDNVMSDFTACTSSNVVMSFFSMEIVVSTGKRLTFQFEVLEFMGRKEKDHLVREEKVR